MCKLTPKGMADQLSSLLVLKYMRFAVIERIVFFPDFQRLKCEERISTFLCHPLWRDQLPDKECES